MRGYIIAACIVAAGCAHKQRDPIVTAWTPTRDQWESVRHTGTYLNRRDGSRIFLSASVVNNMLTAKGRIEETSGVRAELAIVETVQPNAFARIHQGKASIALSTSYLAYFGEDRDALAVTIGHELAHIHLKHDGAVRAERENTAAGIGAVAGTAANFIVPFSGYLVSAASTAVVRGFSRDEERDADSHGIKWAVEAGYDPCGQARVANGMSRIRSGGITLLSTHPSYAERSALADEYAKKATGKGC